jgi:hypothetical protein
MLLWTIGQLPLSLLKSLQFFVFLVSLFLLFAAFLFLAVAHLSIVSLVSGHCDTSILI